MLLKLNPVQPVESVAAVRFVPVNVTVPAQFCGSLEGLSDVMVGTELLVTSNVSVVCPPAAAVNVIVARPTSAAPPIVNGADMEVGFVDVRVPSERPGQLVESVPGHR